MVVVIVVVVVIAVAVVAVVVVVVVTVYSRLPPILRGGVVLVLAADNGMGVVPEINPSGLSFCARIFELSDFDWGLSCPGCNTIYMCMHVRVCVCERT